MTEVESVAIVRKEFTKLVRNDYAGEIDNVPLAELGVDSLDFYEKLLLLEDEYGIEIPIGELDSQVTLGEILSALNSDVD